jgi:hypothetical protein
LAIQDEQESQEQSLSHTALASENDGWSYTGSMFGTQASASIAPSMISGFEVLNVDGSSVRRCNHCSYHNDAEEGICQVCGVALVANPNVDVDLQIALHLSQKFENEELSRLRREEKKREDMHEKPLLERAWALTSDVLTFLQSVQEYNGSVTLHSKSFHPTNGIATIPEVDLLHLTSSFIPTAQGSKDSISFAYVFTLKESFHYVCKNGFNAPVQVSEHVEAAFTEGFTHADISTSDGSQLGRNPVYAVSEDIPEDIATSRLGWIVAVTNHSSGSERSAKVSSGTAPVITLTRKSDCLPLVCFDASIRDKDIVRRLLNGCTDVFHDFFYSRPLAYEVAKPQPLSSPSKRTNYQEVATPNERQLQGIADVTPTTETDGEDSATEAFSNVAIARTEDEDSVGSDSFLVVGMETSEAIAATSTHQDKAVGPFDIYFANGELNSFPGNVRYECAVNEHASAWGLATDQTARAEIVSKITRLLREGGNILELNRSGEWDKMSEGMFRTKVEEVGNLD